MSDSLFANVRLRRVDATAIVDRSAPNLSVIASSSSSDVSLDFNIEHWLPLLGDWTFATEFVSITVDDARMLRDACERFVKSKAADSADAARLAAFADRLAPTLARMMADNGDRGAFVKLSSRSAKDAPGLASTLAVRVRQRCAALSHNDDDGDCENSRLRLLFEIATDFMRMRTPQQIVDAFVCSDRVLQDMTVALERLDRFNENVVVRRWVDIAVDMEFRGFVHRGKLTALAQYFHLVFSRRLVTLKSEILQLIVSAFETHIHSRLSARFSSYVIDFALTGGRFAFDATAAAEPERVWVIELNPFDNCTDGALFSWRDDAAVLRGDAANGVEFRLRSAHEPAVISQLEMRWRELLTEP